MRDVDSQFPEIAQRAFTEVIVAHAANDRHVGAQSRRHHRLVGPLAAVTELKPLACQGLSGTRQAGSPERQIDVRRADDANARFFDHIPPRITLAACFAKFQRFALRGRPCPFKTETLESARHFAALTLIRLKIPHFAQCPGTGTEALPCDESRSSVFLPRSPRVSSSPGVGKDRRRPWRRLPAGRSQLSSRLSPKRSSPVQLKENRPAFPERRRWSSS